MIITNIMAFTALAIAVFTYIKLAGLAKCEKDRTRVSETYKPVKPHKTNKSNSYKASNKKPNKKRQSAKP
jgi:large-conductance mechanosensitive channel